MGKHKPPHDRLHGLMFWVIVAVLTGLGIWAVRALPYFSQADLY